MYVAYSQVLTAVLTRPYIPAAGRPRVQGHVTCLIGACSDPTRTGEGCELVNVRRGRGCHRVFSFYAKHGLGVFALGTLQSSIYCERRYINFEIRYDMIKQKINKL